MTLQRTLKNLQCNKINRDGIAIGWLGYPIFRDKEGCELFVCHMPTFLETFPVVLVDGDGIVSECFDRIARLIILIMKHGFKFFFTSVLNPINDAHRNP